jgi:sugar phosphate isomerase/epimerase
MHPLIRSLVPVVAITAALTVSAAEKAVGTSLSFKGPTGLQLYSLRGEFTKNVPAAIEKVKGFGIQYVELAGTYNLSPEKFKEQLTAAGLKPVSGHFPFDHFRTNVSGIIRDAKALGLEYVGCAWIPHKAPFTEKQARETAEVFNKAGEAMAKEGLKVFYHCHGYEFAPHGDGTVMDVLIKETRPEFVSFEMDVLWVVFPGQDPVKWLEKYPNRWSLLHLKDLKKGVVGNQSGGTDPVNDVALGTGQMNWPAILKAAQKAGVKYYFIEDESPTVLEQIPQTLRYLEAVRF